MATTGDTVGFCYGCIDAVADYLIQFKTTRWGSSLSAPPDGSQLRFVVRPIPVRSKSARELIARALSGKFLASSTYDG